MSWIRLGSFCDGTFPIQFECNVCPECPGSDVYIYESTDGGIECCFCRLFPENDFNAKTVEEMEDHIEAHVAAGHHVRPSLRRGASPVLTDDSRKWLEACVPDSHYLTLDRDARRAVQSESEEQKK